MRSIHNLGSSVPRLEKRFENSTEDRSLCHLKARLIQQFLPLLFDLTGPTFITALLKLHPDQTNPVMLQFQFLDLWSRTGLQ